MIFLVVRSELLEAAAKRLLCHYPELVERMKIVEYSQFLSRDEWPVGTFLFTSSCEMPDAAKRIMKPIEDQLECAGSRLMNRPSRTPRRSQFLTCHGAIPILDFDESSAEFPAVIQCEMTTGCIHIGPFDSVNDLEIVVTDMILNGCDPSLMWHQPIPAGDLKAGLLIDSEFVLAGNGHLPGKVSSSDLQVAWVEYREEAEGLRLWRVDDGPLALLPSISDRSPLKREVIGRYLSLSNSTSKM